MPNIKDSFSLLMFDFDPSGGLITFNQPDGIFYADRKELGIEKLPDFFKLRNIKSGNVIVFQKGIAYKNLDDFKTVLHWEYRSVQNSRYQVYLKLSNINFLLYEKKSLLINKLTEFKNTFKDFPCNENIENILIGLKSYSSSSSSPNNS